MAWLGPCIGPEAFEVGAEVGGLRRRTDAGAALRCSGRTAPASGWPTCRDWRATALAAWASRSHGNDGGDAWCTVTNPSRFFSHRRDRVSGRFAAAVWLL